MSARSQPVGPELFAYIAAHTLPEDRFLKELREASLQAGLPPIWIAPEEAACLAVLLRAARARDVVEVGTLGGYSAVWMARALPPEGRVVTIEANPRFAAFARTWIARADVAAKITLLEGKGCDVLPTLPPASADALFLDADKESYLTYLEQARRLLRPGGLLLADNAFAFGRILTPPGADPEVEGMRRFNEALSRSPDFAAVIVPLGDGLWVAVRRTGRGAEGR